MRRMLCEGMMLGYGRKITLSFAIVAVLASAPCIARTVFDEFEARRSPVLASQASKLAKWAVYCRLNGKDYSKLPMKVDSIYARRAGVFVTITEKGRPRGCWGTIEPRQKDIKHEIIENAIGAALSDTRRKPLAPQELEKMAFCVSIVGPLSPVRSVSELAPRRYGLLVRNGSREGILLPGEAKTSHWQVAECKRKAGLPPDARVQMFVFRTVTLEN